MRRLAVPLLASAVSALALAAAAQDAPVRAVTLYEAGLADLVRETGDADALSLRIPLRDVDDVLKSLLVRGRGIDGAMIALDGPEPVADAFAALPFGPDAARDFETLLRSLPGLRVSVSTAGGIEPRAGQVLEVSESCAQETGCTTHVTVFHDDGAIRRWPLDGTAAIAIDDPEIADALREALTILRDSAAGDSREVTISFTGDDIADGAVSYVIAAPAWKTAYRALTDGDGAVDLQAWAVIENATGEDWEDVTLTLSSGTPRTLRADLFGRDWRYREEAGFGDGIVEAPVVMVEPQMRAYDEAESFGGAMAGIAPPAPAPVAAAATGAEGALDSRFTFDETVDLDAGQMLSMPFLSGALEAENLKLWRGRLGNRTGAPEMRLEIVNDLTVRLPPGIMTVSDREGGYVGDAEVPIVAPGETRAVYYGEDRGIRVEEETEAARTRLSVRLSSGNLIVRSEERREARYAVTVHDGADEVVTIDHPVSPGWASSVVGADAPEAEPRTEDDGSKWLRVALEVAETDEWPGEAVLVMRDVRPVTEQQAIGLMDPDTLVYWSGEVDDAADAAFLTEAARLARAASDAESALNDVEDDIRRLSTEQDRVRRNLGSVSETSTAYERFLADLVAIEDRIGEATLQAERLRGEAADLRAAFDAHVAG
ncbi:DUF4139 domain-containing protein [Wenxinia marina]|uniref:DUF4139 domain-containing protein n=1 Tax=Wenxinia marina DSM 24838 TaxID=1123501 RepID=A0A0D0QDR2_9RHOB|nr:DUF4139 domain-containing protein [Wenxinia marina]KIQ69138.1 hypothetical protein Wenmar_02207 [Wenxinia marina DSM 24838]GGL70585.1 hypothetical protein GCM10011392_26480 [Wenxinia marina]